MSENRKDSKTPQQKKPLTHGWIVVPSKTYPDRVYFYNTITRCSTWNNPCEVSQRKTPESNEIDASSPSRSRSRSRKKSCEPVVESNQGQCKSLHTQTDNIISRVDSDIEDYDEQHDQYFNNVPINAFSLSHSSLISPSSSPGSVSSLKTDISDSESSKCNSLLENNEKQLWVQFVTTPPKNSGRKSIALSDFNEPSTSVFNFDLEAMENDQKNVQFPQSSSKSGSSKYFEISETKKKKTKKKKLKELESGSQKKNIEERIIKSSTFRKRDKTPAQSRLLKLRKQNAEKLKELAIKNPDLFSSKTGNFNKFRNSTSFEEQTFSDSYPKEIDVCNGVAQETGNQFRDEFMEEMDWEPSSEESDVRNINVFRQQLEKVNDSSSDIFFGLQSDHSLPLSTKTYSWFVVLDTNIFVSCLGFVKDLRDMKVDDLGSPVIYVPWRVLQELDHLKDTKIDGVNKRLHSNVRKAINYLNENFKMGHPRVFGQSFEDFAKMVDAETSAPDDEILQTCIKFQRQHPNKKLMLLTNDKNLESKAIVSGIEVYSKERFQEKFVKSAIAPTTFNSVFNRDKTFSSGPNITSTAVDSCLCEIKSILKDFIPSVVETEMKLAFNGDWVKLAFKKPPWNLQDALDCLFKHWRSVFFLVFTKETENEAQRLYEKLFKREAESPEDVVDIITTVQRLVLSIKKSQKKKKPYLDLAEVTLGKLSNVLRLLSPNYSPEVDSGISSSLLSSTSTPTGPLWHGQVCSNEVPSNEVARIKNLFKDIWDSLRNFCCSISDIVHSTNACDNTSLQEVRLKMTQIISQVSELIVIIEKIFEVSPTDISENHSLINHFSNFLISVHPSMDHDLQRDLAKCLAAFFTDFEGRSLLSSSLKDFKEFSLDLMNATDYFNTHLSG